MIPDHLRTKRIWNVADFADFSGLSHKAAKARLQTYNDAMSGLLLIPSRGTNREFTFMPAQLKRGFPLLFEPIESIEMDVEELKDKVGDLHEAQHMIAKQTGANTRAIEKLKRTRNAA